MHARVVEECKLFNNQRSQEAQPQPRITQEDLALNVYKARITQELQSTGKCNLRVITRNSNAN